MHALLQLMYTQFDTHYLPGSQFEFATFKLALQNVPLKSGCECSYNNNLVFMLLVYYLVFLCKIYCTLDKSFLDEIEPYFKIIIYYVIFYYTYQRLKLKKHMHIQTHDTLNTHDTCTVNTRAVKDNHAQSYTSTITRRNARHYGVSLSYRHCMSLEGSKYRQSHTRLTR